MKNVAGKLQRYVSGDRQTPPDVLHSFVVILVIFAPLRVLPVLFLITHHASPVTALILCERLLDFSLLKARQTGLEALHHEGDEEHEGSLELEARA